MQRGIAMLCDYQARLAAQDSYGVLVCLQALDAAGKDGTIRHVMSGVNPQGVHVTQLQGAVRRGTRPRLPVALRPAPARAGRHRASSTGRTTRRCSWCGCIPENLRRQKLPEEAKGKGVWERRYREINDWERYLTDNGFRVVKMFLNLSKEEQRTRFFKRLDLPEKNWKFSAADVRERKRWDDYQEAFSEMLSATSTPWAPWYVIPADHKWFARLCAAAVLVHTLIDIDPQYPEVSRTGGRNCSSSRTNSRPRRPKALRPIRSWPRSRPRPGPSGDQEAKAGKKAKGEEKVAEADAAAAAKVLAKAAAAAEGGLSREAADGRRPNGAGRQDPPAPRAPRVSRARSQPAPSETAARRQTTSRSRSATSSRAAPASPRTRRPRANG